MTYSGAQIAYVRAGWLHDETDETIAKHLGLLAHVLGADGVWTAGGELTAEARVLLVNGGAE